MSSTKENVYANSDNRIFYLSDEIDNSSMGFLCYCILNIIENDNRKEKNKKNFVRQPIKFYVNTNGGNVYDMWSLIDIIINSKTPIYTYCTGYAMSSGFAIFLAGHKRFASKHATFMCHQIKQYFHASYQDCLECIEESNYLQKNLEEYIISRTKITQKYLDNIRKNKKDMYIHIDEALKLGIIDEII